MISKGWACALVDAKACGVLGHFGEAFDSVLCCYVSCDFACRHGLLVASRGFYVQGLVVVPGLGLFGEETKGVECFHEGSLYAGCVIVFDEVPVSVEFIGQ